MTKAAQAQPPETIGTRVAEALRVPEAAARGFNQSMVETVGALPELVAAGLRKISPSLAPEPGYYPQALQRGLNAIGSTLGAPINSLLPSRDPNAEPSGMERMAYGAGRGLGDAAAFMAPGAAMARGAQAGGVAQRIGQAMMTAPGLQAGAGAVGGAVSEGTESPMAGLAASLMTPMAAQGVRRVVSPLGQQMTPTEAELVRMAESMGIKLTPGQATGSKPLQTVESVLTNLPFAGPSQAAIYQKQREAINQAAMESVGMRGAKDVNKETIDDAFRMLGGKYDELARQINVPITSQFLDEIEGIARSYQRRLPTDVKPVIQSYIDDFNEMRRFLPSQPSGQNSLALYTGGGGGPINTGVGIGGDQFLTLMSDMKRRARSAKNTSPDLAEALRGIYGALDDAMIASASPDVSSLWKETNRQYANLKNISKAVKGTAGDAVAGNLPLGRLANVLSSGGADDYVRGRGDLNDLARVAQFLSSRIPDSGTAQRQYWQNMLTAGGIGGGGFAAGGGDPGTAAAVAAAGLALPPIVQKLINSPAGAAYLRNQALPAMSGQDMTRATGNILSEQLLGGMTGGY